MHCTRKITDDITWVGVNDRRLALFENAYPIPHGISYNSYLIKDEKTVLLDTADKCSGARYFENVEHALGGRPLDYLVVDHMEPDHCSLIQELVLRWPEVKIVGNAKTFNMIRQFFEFDADSRAITVNEGDTLNIGRHTLSFYMAPMVHWPEVMVTYDSFDKVLFSADAFGTFGALNGNLFADEVDFEADFLPDARRYYTNIVGKYGQMVLNLISKLDMLDVSILCPLHGPVWRSNIGWYCDKYRKWASWEPEEKGVMIACGSIYGNTMNAAEILARDLAELGVRNIALYDVSATHYSYIVSDAFRFSHLVFAASTYNAGIFFNMETVIRDLKEHDLKKRTCAIIENGTWAPQSGKQMRELLGSMKEMTVLDSTVTLRSSLKSNQVEALEALAKALKATM